MSVDTLRSEVDRIMKAEGITFSYGTVESKPGQWAEAEYRPATKTIVIDEILMGYPDEYQDEPLTLARELGHHFDSMRGAVLRSFRRLFPASCLYIPFDVHVDVYRFRRSCELLWR